jgi:hypothetical protein
MGAPWVIKKVSVPPPPAPETAPPVSEPVKPKDEAPVPKRPRKKATKAPKK